MQIARYILIGGMMLPGLGGFASGQEAPREPEATEETDKKPAGKKQEVQAVEVNAQRLSTTDERRESAAAKIIFGRDEIEKHGDAALVDVLRRLPGVTVNSSGAVSLRGMGPGYTQILIDGERVASGFSIEQLSPEQVERIEILRAPTAETGSRAIAGTINIILRKPRRKKEDDLKIAVQHYHGKFGEDASLSRNDALGLNGTYNVTLTARNNRGESPDDSRVTRINTLTGVPDLDQRYIATGRNSGSGVTINSQLQWKWRGDEQLTLQPFFSKSRYGFSSSGVLIQPLGADPLPYASEESRFDVHFRASRITGTFSKHLNDTTRIEIRAGGGKVDRYPASVDRQFDSTHASVRVQSSDTDSHDTSGNTSFKAIHNFSETGKLTAGAEFEQVRRIDHTLVLLNGVRQLADFGSELDITTRRRAAYLQAEWDPAKDWSANVGTRWEGFETRSNVDADAGGGVSNRSSVLTPLAHLVWRLNAPKKDQLRLSLTQSYQTPGLFSLIPRPRVNTAYPAPGPNTPSFPDFAGNPQQKPERANGLDLAFEHYFPGDGIASVNFFTRRIRDLVRSVISLETVAWATSPRWVQRPRNIGKAISSGAEFDAKFKLTEIVAGAPPIDIRANISLFDSRVDSVPGPNNRLADQPRAKGNLGADYRFTGVPIAVGATISYTPMVTIQSSDAQQDFSSSNRAIDAYVLWTISPGSKLRLTLSNLFPRQRSYGFAVQTGNERQTTLFPGESYPTVALRWEVRL